MTSIRFLLTRLWLCRLAERDGEEGASLVEYALLVGLIAMVCLVAIAFFGQSMSSKFITVGSSVGS